MKLFALALAALLPTIALAGPMFSNGDPEVQRKIMQVRESSVLKNLVDTIEREHSVYCDAYQIELVGDDHFKANSECRNNEGWKLRIKTRGTFVEEMPAMVDGIEMSYGFDE